MGTRRRVRVALATGLGPWPGLAGADALVAVDVLRATSTLTVALENGASRIVPFLEPAAALDARRSEPGGLACGERDGRIVPGFDLGNSPSEYGRERVAGRTLLFASTNGSRVMVNAAGRPGFARWTLGAFVNASATLEAVAGAGDVVIGCAGKLGRFALEDAAFAGWLCVRLAARGAELGNDAARFAATLAPADAPDVRALVEGCSHGRYLRSLGPEFTRDVEFCSTLDATAASFWLDGGGRPARAAVSGAGPA
jgi:2-phosphosulfolactate phosphatase